MCLISLTVSNLRLFQCLLLHIHWYDKIWVILHQHLSLFTFCTWTQVLWKGSSSCSTCDTLVTNPVICHEWEKDCIVIRQMEHIHGHLWHRYTAVSLLCQLCCSMYYLCLIAKSHTYKLHINQPSISFTAITLLYQLYCNKLHSKLHCNIQAVLQEALFISFIVISLIYQLFCYDANLPALLQ